jgi:hypothetical protein
VYFINSVANVAKFQPQNTQGAEKKIGEAGIIRGIFARDIKKGRKGAELFCFSFL